MHSIAAVLPKKHSLRALCLLLWLLPCACATKEQAPLILRERPPAALLLERPIPGPTQGEEGVGAMTVGRLVSWVEALLDHAAREAMDKAALRLWNGASTENNIKGM